MGLTPLLLGTVPDLKQKCNTFYLFDKIVADTVFKDFGEGARRPAEP